MGDEFNIDDFVSTPNADLEKPAEEVLKLKGIIDALEAATTPKSGVDGLNGLDGVDGKDGKDGVDGQKGTDGLDGSDGLSGFDGKDGSDGVSVVDTFVRGDDLFIRLSDGKLINSGNVRGKQGLQGHQGVSGGGKSYRGGGNNLTSETVISKHLGYADYNDASSSATPVTLVADTWTTLPNDGLGSFTNESYLPEKVSTLLDVSGGIDISELELGSDILIRPDFTVTPSANNSALFFRFSLGTGAGSYTLESSFGRLDLGAGIPYRHALQAMYIYAGDTNTRDNPIGLQIKLSGGGTVVNAGMAIKVLST